MTNLNEMAFCLRELGEKDIIHISCCLAALLLSYHPKKRRGPTSIPKIKTSIVCLLEFGRVSSQ